jgi:hypothetical protein
MVKSDVLNQSKLKLQCNTAANLLNERNEFLAKLLEVFDKGTKMDDTGKSANAIFVQCNAYKSLINGMMIANNYDNYDHLRLANLLESETLRGSIILPAIIDEKNSEMSCASHAATCRSHGYSETEPLLASKWFQAADNYDRQADNHRRAWAVWCRKRDHFDNVVAQSNSLFQNSKQYREYIRQGLSDIAFSFSNGTYNVSGWASWKQGIDKLNIEFYNEKKNIVNNLFDKAGRIDQEKVNQLLSKKIDELTPAECALIGEISNLNSKQLAQKITEISGKKVNEEDISIIEGILSAIGELNPLGRLAHSGYEIGDAIYEKDGQKMGEALLTLGSDFACVVSDLAEVAGKGAEALKVGCRWGAHIFDLGINALENVEEQRNDIGMSDGRVVAETVTETAVDVLVVDGGTVLAGAGLVALGVSAPVALVGAGVVALWWGANALTEHFTGEDLTEKISDGILDLVG